MSPAALILVCLWLSAAPDAARGERLYLTGSGSGSRPVRATVQGDVAVSGAQLACVACHARSGMGTVEGGRVVPPIAAPFLSVPHPLKARERPPYDDAALIRAITKGTDPGGNTLSPLMPRYVLNDADARSLVAYLRTLSAAPSPGVSGKVVHFATVIAPDASLGAADATLRVLTRFFAAKTDSAQSQRGWHTEAWPEFYGDWALHVWRLSGPPSQWGAQLLAQYRKQPVFALISGAGGEQWGPVDRFCETQKLPCLFPNVDTPPDTGSSYSRYFSQGSVLEAGVLAQRLAAGPGVVLQLVSPRRSSVAAADALRSALGIRRVVDWNVSPGQPFSWARVEQRARAVGATSVVSWLSEAERGTSAWRSPLPLYVSSVQAGGDLSRARRGENEIVVHPFAMPKDVEERFGRVRAWLKTQKLQSDPAERRVEDQTLFAAIVLSEGFMHLKRNFLREYLLESIDHFSSFENFIAHYPHLSFGPGQRYASKGAYVVGAGAPEWIVPDVPAGPAVQARR